MARDIGGGAIVYGRIPLMLTERCFMKENFGCTSCSRCALTDRTGAKFPIIREYDHRNLILNSTPTYMCDKNDELTRAGILHTHAIFSVESVGEANETLEAMRLSAPLSVQIRRMGKRDAQKEGSSEKPKNSLSQKGVNNAKGRTFSKRNRRKGN
jgi:hypothetical protein